MLSLRRHLRRLTGEPCPFAAQPAMEVIYRDLFLRELRQLDEVDRFFPTGGAANYSLLYLILRIALEFEPRSVLDVGAGQSTLLWSILQRKGLVGEVLTLENDSDWGERIGRQVQHRVHVTKLDLRLVNGRTTLTYDWTDVKRSAPFDVIVCDGPRGLPRHSRCGVLDMLEALPRDFVMIFDDAERTGEQDTITAMHACLKARGVDYAVGVVQAAKSQAVFAAGRYVPATYL